MTIPEKVRASFSGNLYKREDTGWPIDLYLVVAACVFGLMYKIYDKFF